MYTLHAPALQHLLSALLARGAGGGGSNASVTAATAAVEGAMNMFYPVFDEHLQGALDLRVTFVPSSAASSCAPPGETLPDPAVTAHTDSPTHPAGQCERLGMVTHSLGDGKPAEEVCRTAATEYLSDLKAQSLDHVLVTSPTASMPLAAGQHRSVRMSAYERVLRPPLVEQQCKDHEPPLLRQLSLCAAEALHHPQHLRQMWQADARLRQEHLQHPHPSTLRHQHRQQCFWTDTSKLAQSNKHDPPEACSVCDADGYSCTSTHEPLRGWTVAINALEVEEEAPWYVQRFREMCSLPYQPYGEICTHLHQDD